MLTQVSVQRTDANLGHLVGSESPRFTDRRGGGIPGLERHETWDTRPTRLSNQAWCGSSENALIVD